MRMRLSPYTAQKFLPRRIVGQKLSRIQNFLIIAAFFGRHPECRHNVPSQRPSNSRPHVTQALAYAELPQAGTKLDYYPQNPLKMGYYGIMPLTEAATRGKIAKD